MTYHHLPSSLTKDQQSSTLTPSYAVAKQNTDTYFRMPEARKEGDMLETMESHGGITVCHPSRPEIIIDARMTGSSRGSRWG